MVGIVCPLDAKPAKKLQRKKIFLKNVCSIEKSCTFAAQFASGILEIEYRFVKRSGNSSVGRARPCQGRGREFESRFPLNARRCFWSSESRSKRSLIMPSRDRNPDSRSEAEIAQLVEHDLAKVGVASSSLVFRSTRSRVKSGFFV